MNYQSTSEDLQFYKECGTMDAETWMHALLSQPTFPEVSLDEARDMALKCFLENFGDSTIGSTSYEDCQQTYVTAFTREATLQIKHARKQTLGRMREVEAIQQKYHVISHASAARWFCTVSTATFTRTLNEENLSSIAETLFDAKFQETDSEFRHEARAEFLETFMTEAKLYLQSFNY